MRTKRTTYNLVLTGLFIAIGLLLPFVTSHAFGLPGTLLLPMHIPILLCGLLCGWRYGLTTAIVVPVLSSLLTGMPPAYPMLPIMLVQLATLGVLAGLLYRRLRWNIYLSLTLSMVAGWAMYGLVFGSLLLANPDMKGLTMTAAVVQGLPGIAVQLVLIPGLVFAVDRYQKKKGTSDLLAAEVIENKPSEVTSDNLSDVEAPEETAFAEARALIQSEKFSCVVIRDGKIVHTADGRGVSPLMRLYNGECELLRGAFVVDKIIGKAAAMILVAGRAEKVYGEVMSVAGCDFLKKHGIVAQFGCCVEVVVARDKKGICPIEKSVLEVDDPTLGIERIKETIAQLMAAKTQ